MHSVFWDQYFVKEVSAGRCLNPCQITPSAVWTISFSERLLEVPHQLDVSLTRPASVSTNHLLSAQHCYFLLLSLSLSGVLSLGLSLFVLTSRHTLFVKVEQGAETVSHPCRAQSKVPWLHHRSTLTNTLTHTPTVAPVEGSPRLSFLPVLSNTL